MIDRNNVPSEFECWVAKWISIILVLFLIGFLLVKTSPDDPLAFKWNVFIFGLSLMALGLFLAYKERKRKKAFVKYMKEEFGIF